MWFGIDQLRYLDSVARKGSLGAAADELRRAKSAVSKGLSNLEEQLGFTLLDRTEYRVKLTPKGEAFLYRARELLQQSDTLKDYARLIAADMEMKVSLGASVLFPLSPLIELLTSLRETFPKTEVEFRREIMSGDLLLNDGTVDIAITEQNLEERSYTSKKIARYPLPIYLSSKHPFWSLEEGKRTKRNLKSYPNIIQASTVQDPESEERNPPKRWRVTDMESKIKLIEAGFGWGRLPLYSVQEQVDLGLLKSFEPDDEPLEIDLFIAHKKDRPLGQVAEFIWDFF